MDEAAIWAEYHRLGYKLGWIFAMTPLKWLFTAKTMMIGLNPGGGGDEHDSTDACWECPDGNAYLNDRYVSGSDALTPLQTQVAALHKLLALGPEDVFAAQFIPFRSPSFVELPNYNDALAFARKLWSWALPQSPATLFLCLGDYTAQQVSCLIGARYEREWCSGWGMTQVRRYISSDGKIVVGFPHFSRYQLFSMQDPKKLKMARDAIWEATRPANGETESSAR